MSYQGHNLATAPARNLLVREVPGGRRVDIMTPAKSLTAGREVTTPSVRELWESCPDAVVQARQSRAPVVDVLLGTHDQFSGQP